MNPGLLYLIVNSMKIKLIIIFLMIFAFQFAESEIVTLKQARVRVIVPGKWMYEHIDDEMVLTPPDSDFKMIMVTTAFRSLESAFQDATLGFDKITEKREIEINGMPAIFFRAKDIYDLDNESRTFDWLYILFKAPNGYVVNLCGGADSRSDVFFKYYIDINLIYKTLKPTDNTVKATKNTDKLLHNSKRK